MNRREFLQRLAFPGGILLVGGGVLGNRAWARSQLEQKLTSECCPSVVGREEHELQEYPRAARDDMQRWFHGKCLNTAGFVKEICSTAFSEKLAACPTPEQKQSCISVAFYRHVMTHIEALNRVEVIADQYGNQLDLAWGETCRTVADKWGSHLPASRRSISSAELLARTGPLLAQGIQASLHQAITIGNRPTLSETGAKIGKSALLLLSVAPVTVANPWTGVPLFLLISLVPAWEYVIARIAHREGDYQLAISNRLAELGKAVGAELESEFRQRIADLHRWQEQALRSAAHQKAVESMPFFS